jgi:hypothetical protein
MVQVMFDVFFIFFFKKAGLDFWFWPLFPHFSGIKISVTAIAVIENLWAHGRGKFTSKRGSRFCVPDSWNIRKGRKTKKLFGGEKW